MSGALVAPMVRIQDIVQTKTESARERARQKVKTLQNSSSMLTPQAYAETFFPDLVSQFGESNWCNYQPNSYGPRSLRQNYFRFLIPHLVLAPPTLLDMWPFAESEFREHYGLSSNTLEALVDAGAIIPNIYVRTPAEWVVGGETKPLQHLVPILEKGVALGETVDAYLESFADKEDKPDKARKFGDLFNRKLRQIKATDSEQFLKVLQFGFKGKPPTHIPVEDTEDYIRRRVIRETKRMAYVQHLEPKNADKIIELVGEGRLLEACELLRIHHERMAPYSAAAGGLLFNRRGSSVRSDGEASKGLSETDWEFHSEIKRYFCNLVTGIEPVPVGPIASEQSLISFSACEEIRQRKADLNLAIDDLIVDFAERRVPGEKTMDGIREHVTEIRKHIESTRLFAKKTMRVGIGVFVGLETLFWGLPFVGGVAAHRLWSYTAPNAAIKFTAVRHPRRHRILATIDENKYKHPN